MPQITLDPKKTRVDNDRAGSFIVTTRCDDKEVSFAMTKDLLVNSNVSLTEIIGRSLGVEYRHEGVSVEWTDDFWADLDVALAQAREALG